MANNRFLQYEPTDLEYDELQHELFIRNIIGLSTPRIETQALRQALTKEMKGEENPPELSLLNPIDEMKSASIALHNIVPLKNQAISKNDSGLLGKVKSRLAVWINRINRISDKNLENYEQLLNRFHDMYNEILNFRRESPKTILGAKNKIDLHGRNSESGSERNCNSKNVISCSNIDLYGHELDTGEKAGLDNNTDLYGQTNKTLLNPYNHRSAYGKNFDFDLNGNGNRASVNSNHSMTRDDIGSSKIIDNNSNWPSNKIKSAGRGRGWERASLPPNLFSVPTNIELRNNVQTHRLKSNDLYDQIFETKKNAKDNHEQERFRDFEVPRNIQRGDQLLVNRDRDDIQVQNRVPYRGNNVGGINQNNVRDVEFRNLNEYNCRNNHRSQIHKWKILFTGDGKGLSLSEFLTRVSVYARGDEISHEQLFANFHHLLSGKAERWYWSSINEMATFQDLVNGLRNEFLPRNYDYFLREEIQNRIQMPGELFTSFIADLKMLFQKVYPPLDEQYKLYIIRKNMLPQYGSQLAVTDINSVDHLVSLCRRLDENRMMIERRRMSQQFFSVPLVEPSCFPTNFNREPLRKTNYVHEIYDDSNSNFQNSHDQSYLHQSYDSIKNRPYVQPSQHSTYFEEAYPSYNQNSYSGNLNDYQIGFRNNLSNSDSHSDESIYTQYVEELGRNSGKILRTSSPTICHNCKRSGHLLRECKLPIRGIMCFLCGKEGVKIPECNCNSYVRPQNYSKTNGKNVRFSDQMKPSHSGNQSEEAQNYGASALPHQH